MHWRIAIKTIALSKLNMYRGANKGLFVLLSRTQAGQGRTVKQEREEVSPIHIHTFIFPSALFSVILTGRLCNSGSLEYGVLSPRPPYSIPGPG